MKTINLKSETEVVVIAGKEVGIDLSTIELLKTAINSPVQGGYSASDMISRIRLLDAISKSDNNTVSFEDADFDKLAEIVNNTKWSIISRFIVNFIKEFN